MKNIKVLGSGCKNCETTAKLISIAAEQAGVVVDGKVVHAGGLPGPDLVRNWLTHD